VTAVRWTGPLESDLRPNGYELVAPVPPERWPYGPPDHHEVCCVLHTGGLFCDCKASAADDDAWGVGQYTDGRQITRLSPPRGAT
jgi:hypothetical protein